MSRRSALAQGTLEVITLRHSTAEQVIPVLRPLLEPGGALSGQYNQLIVRTSPGNLAQIRAALDAIDRPQRRLTISVRFDSAQDAARRDVQGAVRITSEGNSSAAVRIDNASARQDERVDQRIQVLEGGRATIATGQSRPVRVRQVIQTPSGPVVQETTEIQGAATGFDVVPRLAGGERDPRDRAAAGELRARALRRDPVRAHREHGARAPGRVVRARRHGQLVDRARNAERFPPRTGAPRAIAASG